MKKENQSDVPGAMVKQVMNENSQVMQLIEQFGNNSKIVTKKESSVEIIRRLRIQNKKLQEQGLILKEQLRNKNEERDQMIMKLEYIEKLNQALAEALGACVKCWGENKSCDQCKGKGFPGWQNINMQKFILYILPGLHRIIPAESLRKH